MLGNFLSCSKVAKDPFKVQEGRSDFLQTLERERASRPCEVPSPREGVELLELTSLLLSTEGSS